MTYINPLFFILFIGLVGCGENHAKFDYFADEKERLAQLYYCAEDCGKWDSAYYYQKEIVRIQDSVNKYFYLIYPEKKPKYYKRKKCNNCDTIPVEPRIDIIPVNWEE